MADPWIKFYPTDWRSDPALRLCSRAARGTWIDMLSIMHEATPYGELRVNGVILDARGLAKLLGESADDIASDLADLELYGVLRRREDGAIFSPMLETWEQRKTRPAVPAAVLQQVLERDGLVCVYCGTHDGPFHFDHRIPWSRGGEHSVDNLCVACAHCNLAKSDRTDDEFTRRSIQ